MAASLITHYIKASIFYTPKNINLFFNNLRASNDFMATKYSPKPQECTKINNFSDRQLAATLINHHTKVSTFYMVENICLYFNKLQALNNFMTTKYSPKPQECTKINNLFRQTVCFLFNWR